MDEDLAYRLAKRAAIRRTIKHRKSVQEGQPDRLADLLEEAAREILLLRNRVQILDARNTEMSWTLNPDRMGQ